MSLSVSRGRRVYLKITMRLETYNLKYVGALGALDSRVRGNDEKGSSLAFYEFVKND